MPFELAIFTTAIIYIVVDKAASKLEKKNFPRARYIFFIVPSVLSSSFSKNTIKISMLPPISVAIKNKKLLLSKSQESNNILIYG